MPSPPRTTKRVAALGGRRSIAPPWGTLRPPRRSSPPQRRFLSTASYYRSGEFRFAREKEREGNDERWEFKIKKREKKVKEKRETSSCIVSLSLDLSACRPRLPRFHPRRAVHRPPS